MFKKLIDVAKNEWRLTLETVGTVVFMICSAVFVYESAYKAMILALCAFIFIGFVQFTYFPSIQDAQHKKKIIRNFICSIAPAVIAVVVVSILGKYLKKDFVQNVTKVVACVFNAIIALELTYYDRQYNATGTAFLRNVNAPLVPKTICRLSWLFGRVLVILGMLIAAFISGYAGIAIAGSLVWGFYRLFTEYCWQRYFDYADTSDSPDSSAEAVETNGSCGNAISEHKVESLAKEIAERWTGRERYPSLIAGGGGIRYRVSVNIAADTINFTLGGKLVGVRDDNVNSARIHIESQMQKDANEIAAETQKVLGNYALLRPYSVCVRQGNIEY